MRDPITVSRREFLAGAGAVATATAAGPVQAEWLPAGVDPCGELGEYHTVVTNCPAFSSPLTLTPGQRVVSNGCHAIDFVIA